MKSKLVLLVTALTFSFTSLFAQSNDTLDGYVKYHNQGALDSVTVILKDASGNTLATTVTDSQGYYEFANISTGDYSIELSTGMAPGGVTIVDAYQVLLHKLAPLYFPFNEMQKLAADINDNNNIGWSDFFSILNIISGQSPGGWSFEDVDVQITGNKDRTRRDIGGTADGDPDGSFDPGGKPGQNLIMIEDGSIMASTGEIIEVPVSINNTEPIGGLGIILKYPADLVEIIDVENSSKELDFYVYNGEVRIIWIDQTLSKPMRLTKDKKVFTLKIRTLANFDQDKPIQFTLGRNSDLIGEKGRKFTNLNILIPKIEWKENNEANITNYPNPCNNFTDIEYSIPGEGNVSINLFNITGEKVRTIVNDYMTSGYYTARVDVSDLEAGIYLYQIVCEGITNFTQSKRLIISR